MELVDIAAQAVTLARRHGATAAAGTAQKSHAIEVSWRNGAIETVADATLQSLSLAIFVGHRYSELSTRDLQSDDLSRLVADSVDMARHLQEDPYRALPDESLYRDRPDDDLQIRDPHYEAITQASRGERASELGSVIHDLAADLRIISTRSSVSDNFTERSLVTSNGFSGTSAGTAFSCGVEVTVADTSGRRLTGDDFATTTWLADLPSSSEIAKRAINRAREQLGATKAPSIQTTMILEPRSAPRFVRALMAAMTGSSLQQSQSFLEGQIGKPIADSRLSLSDDPLLRKGLGSRRYDDEGISAKSMPLIENGVLRTFYIDSYYARKLGRDPTTGTPSNIIFASAEGDLARLVDRVKDGIVITGYNGGNSNSTTGDFSYGINGYRVGDGKRKEAITEMNVSGNLRELLVNLEAIGNDPYPYSTIRTPTLIFKNIQFAGK